MTVDDQAYVDIEFFLLQMTHKRAPCSLVHLMQNTVYKVTVEAWERNCIALVCNMLAF
jgi:hypothetical protein